MNYKQQVNAYNHIKQNVARKTKQIVLLYDTCVTKLLKAQQAITEGDVQSRYNYLDQASNIITGLQACLDYEKGGEMAQILDGYYSGIYLRLMSLHSAPDNGQIERIISDIKVMRDAWDYIDTLENSEPEAAIDAERLSEIKA